MRETMRSNRVPQAVKRIWACPAYLVLAFAGCANRADSPPGELFDAGPVFAASTPTLTRRFRVTNTTVARLEVFVPAGEELPRPGMVASPEGLSIALDRRPEHAKPSRGVRRATYHLTVGLTGEMTKPGTSVSHVSIPVGSGPPASAAVTWTLMAPVECSPPQIYFGMVGREELPKTMKVLIRATDGEPFRLLTVDGGSPRVSVKPQEGSALPSSDAVLHILELELRDDGGGLPTVLSGVARIKTDVTVLPEVSVPWSVFFRRSASVAEEGTSVSSALGQTPSHKERSR